ncbi:Wall-associated receptor kinase-like 9 [Morella rubra]|uniref:Wall-associated receptor kinase-like 9 n=1 Tax=Morella rubra TaxID=262757 RepID=A0A6A1USE4_9ROSI|nr:Wall-associated receptor kinase-like 9 [Morella rubra]
MAMKMVFQIILLLCSFAGAADVIDSKCPPTCGNVSIPYPFGIGAGCYLEDWFEIGCDKVNSSDSFRPHLRRLNNLEVLGIRIDRQDSQYYPYINAILVNYPILKSCDNKKATKENDVPEGSPFLFSPTNNSFIAMGCNSSATVTSLDETVTYSGCSIPFCPSLDRRPQALATALLTAAKPESLQASVDSPRPSNH